MSLLDEPGDLAATPLAAVLLEALNQRASGVLAVAHGGGTSRLWFREGRPVGAQVFAGFRPLGMMLLQAGRIDIETLSRSLALMAETHRPQGEILVELGAVSPDEVGRALAEQQAGYFSLIAALDVGAYAFDASAAVPEWTRGSRLSPVRTIVDALERPQANAFVVSALQPVATGAVRLVASYRAVEAAARWSDAERKLVARLERPVPLEAFFAASAVPPERARAVLAALLLLGLAASATETPHAIPSAALAELVPEAEASGEPLLTPAPSAAAAAVPPAAPPPRRSDPAEARARRQKLLQQAMRNLGVGPFAGRDGARPPPPAPAAPRAGAPAAGNAPGAAPGAAPPAPASPAASAEAQLRAALLAVAPRARERDLFARLGLPDGAGREDAKKAFLAIARQFHPDRFAAPELADLQVAVRDFFAAVNEAYDVLTDDRKRAAYLAARKGSATANAEAARVDFQKAEACFRTRDFQRGRGFLESAIRADPRAEYQAALAWSFLVDPARKDRERARQLLAEATKDPACDRAQYVAGILARDEGDEVGAERSFRAAVKANPRNADAVRELRQLEARRADRRR